MTLQKTPVRKLAWDYYLGKLESHDEFRRRRSLVINATISGTPMPEFDSVTGLSEQSDVTETPATSIAQPTASTPNNTAPEPESSLVTSGNSGRIVAIATLSVVTLVAAVGYFLFSGDEANQLPPSQSIAAASQPLPAPLQVALSSLQNNGWSSLAANDFLNAWQSLSNQSKTKLRESPSISAVTEQVAVRSAELITMAGAGIAITGAEKMLINDLALALGFSQPQWPKPTIEKSVSPIAQVSNATDSPAEPGASANSPTQTSESDAAIASVTPLVTAGMVATETHIDNIKLPAVSTNQSAPQPAIPEQEPATKPAPIKQKLATLTKPNKPSRPASIVMSEQEGCSAQMVNLRVRTCRDFLSRKVRAPRMVVMPSGNFTMGDPRRPLESPTIEVTIPSTLAISSHEISFREFLIYCKNSSTPCPTNDGGDRHQPVVGVSWQEAANYTAWLSERTGKQYRLPSEAEWEYAARAGTQTTYPFGDKLMVTEARFSERNRTATEPLSNSYQAVNPNQFQLYHMVGNVREWVADAWQDHHDTQISNGLARNGSGQRVVRGGSFADSPEQLRSSARQPLDANSRDRFTGFRIVLDFAVSTS